MIPHTPNIPGKVPSECFFLVEKPGLGVAIIARVTGSRDRVWERSMDRGKFWEPAQGLILSIRLMFYRYVLMFCRCCLMILMRP